MHIFLLSRLITSNLYRRTDVGFLRPNAFFIFNSFASKHDPLQLHEQEENLFTVSYLINSCGLSHKAAVGTSKYLRLQNPTNPDSVLNLLKNYGLSETQRSKIVKAAPQILISNPEILLPKIKFLLSIGVSRTDLPEIIVCNPLLLRRSLDNCLIPRYEILKGVGFSNEEVIQCIKCGSWSYGEVIDNIVPNMQLLRELGVPRRFVRLLVTGYPDIACIKHTKFVEAVNSAKEMGFDPMSSSFILCIQVLAKVKPHGWKSRLEIYEKWGWTRDVAFSAFRKIPNCMLHSEEKIGKTMNFIVNKMGYPSEVIAGSPLVLSFSLEKRIIPRWSVVHALKSKGLIKNDLSCTSFLCCSSKLFEERWVLVPNMFLQGCIQAGWLKGILMKHLLYFYLPRQDLDEKRKPLFEAK